MQGNGARAVQSVIRTMGLRKTDKVVCHGLSVNPARVRCSVEYAPTDDRGRLDYDGLEHVFDDSVRLLVVPMLELETGEELRFDSLVRMAHVHGCRVLVDTTCCVGYRSIDATALAVDFLLASGHGYLRGPPGVTACICHSENDALVLRSDAAFCGIDEAYVAPASFCECYACVLRARILTCPFFFDQSAHSVFPVLTSHTQHQVHGGFGWLQHARMCCCVWLGMR